MRLLLSFQVERERHMPKSNPRRSNGHRRDKLRQRVKAQGRPCAVCGRPIDYSLPAGHEWSYELDEIVPVRDGGSPYDPDNVQPVHRVCNRAKYQAERRGAKRPTPPVKASRSW